MDETEVCICMNFKSEKTHDKKLPMLKFPNLDFLLNMHLKLNFLWCHSDLRSGIRLKRAGGTRVS